MARIAEIVKAMFKRRGNSPGKSVVIQLIASGDEEEQRTTELWHAPGISSAPTNGDRAIVLPIGRGSFKVAIATRNHRIEVEPGEGETIIYSTNATGDTVQSTIKLDASGNIDLNGDGKRLVTYGELNTALQSFKTSIDSSIASAIVGHTHSGVTTGPGVSGPGAGAATVPTSLDISAAETSTLRTDG